MYVLTAEDRAFGEENGYAVIHQKDRSPLFIPAATQVVTTGSVTTAAGRK